MQQITEVWARLKEIQGTILIVNLHFIKLITICSMTHNALKLFN